MKKVLLFLFASSITLMVVGCKEDKCVFSEGLNGEVMPDECYDCEWYAPEGVSVSWTEYNTVSEVLTYFNGHRETLRSHLGDTLLVMGWVCAIDSLDTYFWRVGIADYPHQAEIGYEPNIMVVCNPRPHQDSSYFLKKVYVKCIVGMDQAPPLGNPCAYGLIPYILKFDTINEKK